MKDGFNKLRENTTASPSSRHLGNCKSLLVSDDEKDKEFESFNIEMLTVYNTIINVAIIIGTLFNRWKISIAVVIGKIQDGTKISRLRLINLYKTDHNLILKSYFVSQSHIPYISTQSFW